MQEHHGDASTEPPLRTFCDLDDERIRTFGLLLEAHARLTQLLDADLRADADVTLQTYEVLLRIASSEQQRITMSALAGGLALTTGGVTRLAYTPADVRARDTVAGWMRAAGLQVCVDDATNLFGRLPGSRWRRR